MREAAKATESYWSLWNLIKDQWPTVSATVGAYVLLAYAAVTSLWDAIGSIAEQHGRWIYVPIAFLAVSGAVGILLALLALKGELVARRFYDPERNNRQRKMIDDCREMIAAHMAEPSESREDFKHYAARHTCIMQIKPFLSEGTRKGFRPTHFIVGNDVYDGLAIAILKDLEKLEREWGL